MVHLHLFDESNAIGVKDEVHDNYHGSLEVIEQVK